MVALKTPVHGGRVFEAARDLGLDWTEILDFSANINPLGQPKGLRAALFNEWNQSLHYPEDRRLANFLAEKNPPLAPESILVGAGSTPHLYLLARGLKFTRPVIVGPAFAEYEAALRSAGHSPEYALTLERDDWLVTPDTVGRLWEQKPDAVFLANPANPTGRLVPQEVLGRLAEEAHKRKVWLIVDEAFIDFTEGAESLAGLTAKNPRLVVLRSLTKIFALPGLRLAWLAAHPQTLSALQPLLEPWPVSSPALTAGFFCLAQDDFVEKSKDAAARLRKTLIDGLRRSGLAKVYPSESNYVLADFGGHGPTLLAALYKSGILVRDASNFKGLKRGYLRLAVRPAAETKILLAALAEYSAAGQGPDPMPRGRRANPAASAG